MHHWAMNQNHKVNDPSIIFDHFYSRQTDRL
jgi:hypothetical protein